VYQWLFYAAVLTAFLTSFYVFRAYFMTFFGEELIPEEAGSHAHESPAVMWIPLAILAVFAVFVGIWFDQTWRTGMHHFNEFLAQTPSLAGGLVAATKLPYEFHLTTAAMSAVIACAGIVLALYFYVGDPREIRAVKYIMDFEWAHAVLGPEQLSEWRQLKWVDTVKRAADQVSLGWLASFVGGVLLVIWIVITSPLLVLQYVSPYRLSYDKFYFDEIYNVLFVTPTRWAASLLYWLDRWLIDGLVNAIGRLPVWLGQQTRSMQFGLMSFYALAMVVVMLAFFAARVMLAAN
jgi:NADH-quinone oxidoreductase subunit L